MNKTLLVIVGPTGIGKTNLSIQLGKALKCEIVSADSRQFYKEMSIGTAVPTPEELQQVKHHLIQHKSITENYSVGDFEKEAITVINQLFETNNFVILVGGSGLYINAVISGLDHFPDIEPAIRKQLQAQFDAEGLTELQKKLKTLDPVHYNNIDLYNPQRLIRALEICIGTGQPYSSFLTQSKKNRPFNSFKIGLEADRSVIYNRINTRVDLMMEAGLLNEGKKLVKYRNLNALNTVGYKELFNFFEGKWELDFSISEIKKNTRRFAKRQLTWNRKDSSIHWFNYKAELHTILSIIQKEIGI